jgi:hypothetical protein
VWQDYEDRGLVVLAADCWNGIPFVAQGFVDATGITFPLLLDAAFLQSAYVPYDNYVVIDPTGIVRYTSVDETFLNVGRWNDAAVRSVVEQWLPTTATVPTTWSGLKSLYRSPP